MKLKLWELSLWIPMDLFKKLEESNNSILNLMRFKHCCRKWHSKENNIIGIWKIPLLRTLNAFNIFQILLWSLLSFTHYFHIYILEWYSCRCFLVVAYNTVVALKFYYFNGCITLILLSLTESCWNSIKFTGFKFAQLLFSFSYFISYGFMFKL